MSGAAASPAQPSPACRGVRRAPAPLLPSLRRRPGWVSVALPREVLAAQAPRTVAVPARRWPRPGRGPAGPRGLSCLRGPPGALPRPPHRDSSRAACPRPEAQPGPGPSGLCPLRAAPPSAPRPAAPGAAGGTPLPLSRGSGSSAGGFTSPGSTERRGRPGRALALREQLGSWRAFPLVFYCAAQLLGAWSLASRTESGCPLSCGCVDFDRNKNLRFMTKGICKNL